MAGSSSPTHSSSASKEYQPSETTFYACRTCYEVLPDSYFIQWNPLPDALEVPHTCVAHLAPSPRHPGNGVCKWCIFRMLCLRHQNLGAGGLFSGCTNPDCGAIWDTAYIVGWFAAFPGNEIEQYNMDMTRIFINDPATPIVACPSCGHLGLVDAPYLGWPQVECASSSCKARFCVKCLAPWHSDAPCAGWKDGEDAVTLELAEGMDAKRCPNCHIIIVKDGGCRGMECSRCGKWFDWQRARIVEPGSVRRRLFQSFDAMYHGQNKGCEASLTLFNRVERACQAGRVGFRRLFGRRWSV